MPRVWWRPAGGLRNARGGAEAPRVRRPAWVAERLRGPMPRVYGGLRRPRNAREGRCPACAAGGVGRGTPARAEAPRVRRPAERPRGADVPRMATACGRPAERLQGPRPRVGGGLREACGTPARADVPRMAAACGRPAERLRGPMPRVYGGPRGSPNARVGPMPRVCGGLRSACGTPAGADAPRGRRSAECLPNPRGGRCPPAHNAGGTHSASPQTVEQSFARGLPGRGSAGPSARRGRPPANPAACAVNQAS